MFDLSSIRDWSSESGFLVIVGAGIVPSDALDPQNIVDEFCDATYFIELEDLPFFPQTAEECFTLIEQLEPSPIY